MNSRHLLLLTGILLSITASAQFHAGIFTGVSNYYGDLNDKIFNRGKPAVGLTVGYALNNRLSIRSGFTYGRIEGADKFGGSEYLETHRNLEFQTELKEYSLAAELNLFSGEYLRWTPYVFGGVAIFQFDPYATSTTGERVYLQPLGTEGQGLPEYPERQPYKLTDLSLPFGFGLKYHLSETVDLGLEIGYRKTFTDYLDDVSTNYADPNALQEGNGQMSVMYANRANENPLARSGYPASGSMRGNPGKMDSYYFTGIHFNFNLARLTGRDGGGRGNGHYSDLKCPPVPR